MKGDKSRTSKKGQERRARRGPGGEEHWGPPGFAPSGSCRASQADPPLQIIRAAEPPPACQGSSRTLLCTGAQEDQTLKLS